MGEKTQRIKGKTNETVGKAKGTAGYRTRDLKTETKGHAQTVKGQVQQTVGKARKAAK
jgi:uncharacterized protein YjbJ (UPF0337 family)